MTKIGDNAFKGCKSLTSIVFPNSLTDIGSCTFQECTGLTSIDFPDSVLSIASSAFKACTNLTSVVIPKSIIPVNRGIGREAFSGCTSLTSIVVAEDNPGYDSREGCNAIIETATNKLVVGCKATVIPNSVRVIGEEAFGSCSLTDIVIPNSVEEIEYEAFEQCQSLTCVIPETVKIINVGAFWGCENLTKVVVPANIKMKKNGEIIDTEQGLQEMIKHSKNCEIVFAGFVKEEEETKEEMPQAEAVTKCEMRNGVGLIPQGVREIESEAFKNKTDLTSITIPDTVEKIGYRAFEGCTALTSIVIPDSVKEIGQHVFEGCTGLTKVVLPRNYTIDHAAYGGHFKGCTGLTEVSIDSDWLYGHKPNDHFRGPGDDAPFLDCTGITTIHLSPAVKRLTGFTGCTGLKELVVPDTVESIGNYAFYKCKGLKTITTARSSAQVCRRIASRKESEKVIKHFKLERSRHEWLRFISFNKERWIKD